MAIAKHELVDYYRRRKIKTFVFSHFPFLKNIVDKALGPELALEEREAKEKILLTFEKISEGYVEILRLKYMDGLSMREIAERLKITVKAVESRLARARKAFRKHFGKRIQVTPENLKVFSSFVD